MPLLKLPKNVKVTVRQVNPGETPTDLVVGNNGQLGRLVCATIRITTTIAQGLRVIAANPFDKIDKETGEREHKLVLMGNRSRTSEARRYIKDVKISDRGTHHPENSILLLEVDGNRLQIYKVAVIGRDGDFFLVTDLFEEMSLFQKNGFLVVSGLLTPWPDLTALLNESLGFDAIVALPEIPDEEQNRPELQEIEEGTAKVLWWSHAIGCGAIKGVDDDGKPFEAQVDWRETPNRDGMGYLRAGEVVTWERLVKPVFKEPKRTTYFNKSGEQVEVVRARTQTTFEWLAKGVRVVKAASVPVGATQ